MPDLKEYEKILSEIYTNLVLVLTSIILIVTWPFILFGVTFHTLFKSKIKDNKKLEILREITIIFVGLAIFLVLSILSDRFSLL